MKNLVDLRIVQIDATPTSQNFGSFVPVGHMRNIHALKYTVISGIGTSGLSVNLYDTWGTSNNLIDKYILKNMSGTDDQTHIQMWPMSPRPDFVVGHVKESGIATVQTSGCNFGVVMIYSDTPEGVY